MKYQNIRPGRLRASAKLRAMIRETRFLKENLVMPLFFKEGEGKEAVESMPGIEKMGRDLLLKKVEELQDMGIKAVILFASSSEKDSQGSSSYDENSSFHKLIRQIKQNSDIVLITDVCLCAYTDHGHCGVIRNKSGLGRLQKGSFSLALAETGVEIDNRETLTVLAKIALSHAKAGADIVAPSAMVDSQVNAIREELDKNDFFKTAIMSYSVKYASGFYGPFRDIYKSSPVFADRAAYQMDACNKTEAIREVLLDVEEGADIVMVKPALPYLDIISAVRQKATVPVAAYNVSGEYSMLKAAAHRGWLDERQCALEMLNCIKRAGADIIITYWAEEAVRWLNSQE